MKMNLVVMMAALTLISTAAMARDSQESHDVFVCGSLPYVDSALEVVGIADEYTGAIDVIVLLGNTVVAQDRGQFVEGTTTWEGDIFSIYFDKMTVLTAKKENAVLSVGQSDSLLCQYPNLP
ncbi:hypothetical protein QJS83_12185 [Bdellovibrio sp. 22V]|uniref:hypothetical protein n=1 Tax=Bdellovibrio TaxID=958 RepID=UPI002543A65D|nr:hypothetical protein [Bdellovibrio sp. 22V]WII71219.1 hypothetical protein QJS83_12185 [Bdellovibrio sp. 22V]